MRWIWAFGGAIAIVLTGCASDDDFLDEAVEQARAQCVEQGGEFMLHKQPKVNEGELMQRDVEIDAECIGPDDPRYLPQKKKAE
ncbi:MAG TPA: hypothetical protein VN154_06080 [Rhizomicrobium sp.]|nr:hypothetical protein [Rhizomicrobium sp.]